MLSINMRIFKTILLLAAIFSNAQCSPVKNETLIAGTPGFNSTSSNRNETVYDQRQNGTSNIHIHLEGALFLIARTEDAGAIISAVTSLKNKREQKPGVNKTEAVPKVVSAAKSAHRAGLRLASLPFAFTRRLHRQ